MTKVDIAWASRSLIEANDYAADLRKTEGSRGAQAFLSSRDCVWRCSKAIEILRGAKEPLPEFVVRQWAYLRAIGWHNLPDAQNPGVAA